MRLYHRGTGAAHRRRHECRKKYNKNHTADRRLYLETAHCLCVPAFFRQPFSAAIQHRRFPHCRELLRQQCACRRQFLRQPDFSHGRFLSGDFRGRRRGHRQILRRQTDQRGAESRSHDGCLRTHIGHLSNRCGHSPDFPHPYMDGDAGGRAARIHGLFPHLFSGLPVLRHVQCLCGHSAVRGRQPAPADLSDRVLRHQHRSGLVVYRRTWIRRRRGCPCHYPFAVFQRLFMPLAADPQKPGGLPRAYQAHPFRPAPAAGGDCQRPACGISKFHHRFRQRSGTVQHQ